MSDQHPTQHATLMNDSIAATDFLILDSETLGSGGLATLKDE